MGFIRAAFELRMVLDPHKEGMIRKLHRLDQSAVRGKPAQDQPASLQSVPIIIVELIAMAMPFTDVQAAVAAFHHRTGADHAGIRTETQRAAFVDLIALSGHEVDHLVWATLIEFPGIGIADAGCIPREFSDSDLHPEADPEIGDPVFPCVLRGQDHPRDPAAAEPSGDDDAIERGKDLFCIFGSDLFRIDPVKIDVDIMVKTRVMERFSHGQISVVKGNILSDQSDLNTAGA